jgi:hypothetical protein
MRLIEAICIGALILFGALMALFLRRELISRGSGTIDMSLRLNTFVPERGWAPGLGRFSGDELRWYRLFSFGVRPRRVLRRTGLVVEARRVTVRATCSRAEASVSPSYPISSWLLKRKRIGRDRSIQSPSVGCLKLMRATRW